MDSTSYRLKWQSAEWFDRRQNNRHPYKELIMTDKTFDTTVPVSSQELSGVSASSAMKLFENPLFKVRVIMRLGDPWFVAKDVATCIEHSNVTKMCDLCRDKDIAIVNGKEYSNDLLEYSEGRGNPNITVISESGLYRILAKCNLPKCEPFENWVFDEVLPSIRKTGSYSVTQANPSLPSYMLKSEEERAIAWAEEHRQARLALEAKEREIQSLQAQKDVMRQEYKSNKDFCNELIAKGVAVQKNGKPYALSTLRSRMSPILQEVSHTYRYSISEETVVVDGVERKTPYYHRDVCDMVAAVVTPQWLAKPTTDCITMKQ